MPKRLDYVLTNDDGIFAPGLESLRRVLAKRARFTVAAPAGQRSAVGHSITIHSPILCDSIRFADGTTGYAVDGTPADTVKLALSEIVPKPPRFVLSGINFGANLGVNVFYSGTVAAALEASFAGVPSFALSLCTKSDPRWEDAAKIAREVVEEFTPFVEGSAICLNVNIPNLPARDIKGVRFTHQARTPWKDWFHRRKDPRGRSYYWMDGDRVLAKNGHPPAKEMTDVEAVKRGFVSITPLRLTMTCEATVAHLSERHRSRPSR